MIAEVRKLQHLGIEKVPRCSTLSGVNVRHSNKIFEAIYRNLYESNNIIIY